MFQLYLCRMNDRVVVCPSIEDGTFFNGSFEVFVSNVICLYGFIVEYPVMAYWQPALRN